jgi:hypothetical protein
MASTVKTDGPAEAALDSPCAKFDHRGHAVDRHQVSVTSLPSLTVEARTMYRRIHWHRLSLGTLLASASVALGCAKILGDFELSPAGVGGASSASDSTVVSSGIGGTEVSSGTSDSEVSSSGVGGSSSSSAGGSSSSSSSSGGSGSGGATASTGSTLDLASVLVDDTILNNGTGALDPTQTALDGSGYVLVTQSAATALGGSGAHGLPNDAYFPANASHPEVKLHWNNADDGPNSRLMKPGDSFSFAVPMTTYTQVQIYGLSTEGASSVKFTLTYSDASTDVRTITFPDWFADPAAPGQFFLIDGLDRVGSGVFQPSRDPAISGVNLDPNPGKELVSITLLSSTTSNRFTLFGAAAW